MPCSPRSRGWRLAQPAPEVTGTVPDLAVRLVPLPAAGPLSPRVARPLLIDAPVLATAIAVWYATGLPLAVISAPSGSGKTISAVATAIDDCVLGTPPGSYDRAEALSDLSAKYVSVQQLEAIWSLPEWETDRSSLFHYRFLIVDDVGREPLAPTTAAVLFDVINRRRSNRATMLLTHLSREGLEFRYEDPGIWNRVDREGAWVMGDGTTAWVGDRGKEPDLGVPEGWDSSDYEALTRDLADADRAAARRLNGSQKLEGTPAERIAQVLEKQAARTSAGDGDEDLRELFGAWHARVALSKREAAAGASAVPDEGTGDARGDVNSAPDATMPAKVTRKRNVNAEDKDRCFAAMRRRMSGVNAIEDAADLRTAIREHFKGEDRAPRARTVQAWAKELMPKSNRASKSA